MESEKGDPFLNLMNRKQDAYHAPDCLFFEKDKAIVLRGKKRAIPVARHVV